MKPVYKKKFEIRWSDLDANRHLLNATYVNYMSHTRMSFLFDHGVNQKLLREHSIGPVALHEHIYYFQEIQPGQQVTCTMQLSGISKDGTFFGFHHRFYNNKGDNCALGTVIGGWISLESRRLTPPPLKVLDTLNSLPRISEFKEMTKEDTRVAGVRRLALDQL